MNYYIRGRKSKPFPHYSVLPTVGIGLLVGDKGIEERV
jgi:hypothetical protein